MRIPEIVKPPKILQPMDFGCTAYEPAWRMQQRLVEERLNGDIPDTLMLGEHPAVITIGKKGRNGRKTQENHLLSPTVPVVNVERGGDVTYHGPGQLIAYPILLLPPGQRDLHQYLRELEQVVIDILAEFDLEGHRNPGWTGVWVKSSAGDLKKIASIGVALSRWVTYHGVALNVNTDLDAFNQIQPCGLEPSVMTSMAEVFGESMDMETVKAAFYHNFEACMGYDKLEDSASSAERSSRKTLQSATSPGS